MLKSRLRICFFLQEKKDKPVASTYCSQKDWYGRKFPRRHTTVGNSDGKLVASTHFTPNDWYGQRFPKQSNAKNMSLSGELPYECPTQFCESRFSNFEELQRHVSVEKTCFIKQKKGQSCKFSF